MSELYRDFIDRKADQIITDLGGTITPAPSNVELYRDFLNRKADDVITALNGTITPAPINDELYRDFIERKFDDVISGIGGYVPPISFPTLTGSIVTFNSQYAGLPLKSHKIALTATQSGSGTPSPDNVRPISGWDAIHIGMNGQSITVQIGSTVYGGEYDARTGVLTVTHGIVDLGTLNWVISNRNDADTGYIFYTRSTKFAPSSPFICSIFNDVGHHPRWESININEGLIYRSAIPYLVLCSIETSKSSFETAMDGVQLVYELATPTTIQLAPSPIDTLLGENNIWADTGDTTLQYIKIGGNT